MNNSTNNQSTSRTAEMSATELKASLEKTRHEIITLLGYQFKYESHEFTLDEDLIIKQNRSSLAGHGSAAFHSYLKESKREEDRVGLMKAEWDEQVKRLEEYKRAKVEEEKDSIKLAQNEAKLKEKEISAQKQREKRKKQRKNKKNKGSDSDDSDSGDDQAFVSLVMGQLAKSQDDESATATAITNSTSTPTAITTIASTFNTTSTDPIIDLGSGLVKRKAEVQIDSVPDGNDDIDRDDDGTIIITTTPPPTTTTQ